MQLGDVDFTLTATNQPILMSNSALMLTKVTVCNTDSVARTITIYRVGGGASPGLPIIDGTGAGGFSIGIGETKTLPLSGFVLQAAESIQGLASSAGVVQLSLSYIVP